MGGIECSHSRNNITKNEIQQKGKEKPLGGTLLLPSSTPRRCSSHLFESARPQAFYAAVSGGYLIY